MMRIRNEDSSYLTPVKKVIAYKLKISSKCIMMLLRIFFNDR